VPIEAASDSPRLGEAERAFKDSQRRAALAEGPAMSLIARLRDIAFLLLLVQVLGVVGYVLIEDWSLLDALYMTVITLGTVGYGETNPLSQGGRIFTIGLIYIGIGAFTYALSTLAAFWVEAHVFGAWRKRRMEQQIASLKDHVIVCGGGETAFHIAQELSQTLTPFVVIERDASEEERLQQFATDALYLIGDASDGAMLRRARIDTARALVACMSDDKENLFTVFEARDMNPDLRIVSRLVDDDARHRLVRAGADAIVPMQRIGALRIASEALRPHVVSVLDVMLREPGQIRVQEIQVGSGAAGSALSDVQIGERAGVTIFALREAETLHHVFNPPPSRVLVEGDVLIGCADPHQLEVARRLARTGRP
jgi:voltage-gated potassium channel